MELRIEYVDKTTLKPYAKNAKLHPDEQVAQIIKSIRKFGFNDPIAVWGDSEVVEGHGRLLAVMQMDEIQTVPIIRLDHLTEKQRRAYALAHNKLTMNSGFDFAKLTEELREIPDMQMDEFGFSDFVLGNMFEDFDPDPYEQQYEAEQGENGLVAFNCVIACTTEEEKEWLKELFREPKDLHRLYDCSTLMERYELAD